jgi:CDP-paratose synthetase
VTFVNISLQQFYGPGDGVSKLPGYVLQKCLHDSGSIELTDGAQLRDFIFIDDVVDAYIVILSNIENTSGFLQVELGTGVSVPVKQFIELIHEESKSTCRLKFGAKNRRLDEPDECIADPSYLYALGWTPKYTLHEGVKKMVEVERDSIG